MCRGFTPETRDLVCGRHVFVDRVLHRHTTLPICVPETVVDTRV